MVEAMSLRNFKGWEELPEARFANLTGFFGPNSAGKSSLVQLLLLLKQTVESPDRHLAMNLGDERDPRTLVQLGTFRELVFRHDLQRQVSFSMTFRPREPIKARPYGTSTKVVFVSESVVYSAVVDYGEARGISVSSLRYGLNGRTLALTRNNGKYKLDLDVDNLGLKRQPGRPWEFPQPVKCYGFPDRVRTDFQNPELFLDLEQALEGFFIRDLFYLGPLRYQPERTYTWAGARPEDVGTRGEHVVAALLGSRASGATVSPGYRKHRQTLEQRVADWLRALDLVDDFRVVELAADTNRYRVEVRVSGSESWVSLPDVGVGVSQVLPVLTLCYYVPEGSTIILEHPEIHLHPAVQSGLADVLLDAIKTRGVQIIVESHSEHFLRRLQRRVAEESIVPTDVALYFCRRVSGASVLDPLEVNMFGDIENWPRDFFGDQMGELISIQEAGLQRRVGQHNAG